MHMEVLSCLRTSFHALMVAREFVASRSGVVDQRLVEDHALVMRSTSKQEDDASSLACHFSNGRPMACGV